VRPKRLGIVANEFLALELGRMGGFGWAAREAANALAREWPATESLFLSCEHRSEHFGPELEVHGRRLLTVPPEGVSWRERLRDEGLDALLTIDYRPSYAPLLAAFPRRRTVVWARDPRSRGDMARIAGLRVPGRNGQPAGTRAVDCTELGRLVRRRRLGRRSGVRLATVAPGLLSARAAEAYATPGGCLALLPNPLEPVARPHRAARPAVVFLGRLDPIKRPWIVVEVARRLPGVRFDVLGQIHFEDDGAWAPRELPPNVHLHGHVDGEAKRRLLGEAWALINTSIHEGLPVSMLEALAAETPVVACLDPDGVVSRFGVDVGRFGGDGLEAVPAFEQAIRDLIARPKRVSQLGSEGRRWVESTHTPGRFAAALDGLLEA
jgi:glycosyltransferase involved in cell wall biosynthesis